MTRKPDLMRPPARRARAMLVNAATRARKKVAGVRDTATSRPRPRRDGSGCLLSSSFDDIISAVKQLLLRVPEDIHRRLAARARREGRSINAVATEILDAAAESDRGDRRARLRAAAAAAGMLRPVQAGGVSAARRRRIIDSTRGLGAQVDRLLARERERA